MARPDPTPEKQPGTRTKAGLAEQDTDNNPKTTSRSRSACDACRRSKIRCTGGNPCSTCQWSHTRCHYTPGRRLGRPKGSKNRRTLVRQCLRAIDEQREESWENTIQNNADAVLWAAGGQQPPFDTNDFDFDLDHGFNTTSGFPTASGSASGGNYDLIDSSLGLIDPICTDASPLSLYQVDSRLNWDAERLSSPERALDSGSDHGPAFLPSTESNSPLAPCPSCPCLQQLARLLYQLEDLGYSNEPNSSGVSVDSLLRGVQTAELPWRGLMHCSVHKTQDDHKSALLLFAMSIRKVLNRTISQNVPKRSEASTELTVSIGTFKLTGKAKTEVVNLALGRAMRDIIIALHHLWARIGWPTAAAATEVEGTSLGMQSLMKVVDAVDGKDSANQSSVVPATQTYLEARKGILSLLEMLQKSMEGMEQ